MTIDDLLKGLQRPKNEGKTLNGSKRDIWERIGRHDRFLELGLTEIEEKEFIDNWILENPYSSL